MEAGTEKRYQEFISASKEVDDLYHMLALKFNLSVSMSRQTVNSAIKNLEKQGYLRLEAVSGDRRNKTLSFTEEGEAFVKRTVDRVLSLEHQVFENLEVEEQEQITQILRKYTRLMREGAEKI